MDTQDTSIQVIGKNFQAQMNFYQANLLTHPSQPKNQNDLTFHIDTNPFVVVFRKPLRNVNSATKAQPNVAKNKGANKLFTKRKASNYLLK